MIALISRNLKVYFRDKTSVFFSLLSVIIIFVLYLLFLGDVWKVGMPNVDGIDAMMNSWIMAGIIAVASITTVMGAFGTMVDDKSNKIDKDFSASPISRSKIVAGYELSSFIIGVIMSLFMLVLAEGYIVLNGGELLDALSLIKIIALIMLSALSNTAFVAFIVSFVKTQSAFGTLSTIIGTLIGFLTGIYLPIGMLPTAVQTVVKLFPVSHAALLIRQTLMQAPMDQIFSQAPDVITDSFKQEMGVIFKIGGQTLPAYVSVLILVGSTILFYLLATLKLSKKHK